MRAAVVLVLVACGRIGFDGEQALVVGDSDTSQTPALCNAHAIGDVPSTAAITELRATIGDIGYVVALGTASDGVYVARIPSSLDNLELHMPLGPGFKLTGLSTIGNGTFIHTTLTGVSYLKVLDPSFDTYATVIAGDEVPIVSPTAARPNGNGWRLNVGNGLLDIAEVMPDGTTTGIASAFNPPATSASVVANRVVVGSGEACETFLLNDAGAEQKLHTVPTPCREPRLAVLDNGTGMLVYRDAPSSLALYAVPASETATGPSISLGDTSAPRIAASDVALVLYSNNGAVQLGRFDAQLTGSTATVPEVKSPYDITRTAVFWLDATTLRVATPCLR